MTGLDPDPAAPPPREFYGPAAVAAPTDPALDPPCTIRVQGGHDRATRYSPHARRAVRTTSDAEPWVLVAGPRGVGGWLTHDEVRDWTVMPALFATVPWTIDRAPARVEPAGPLVGDMDVEAFRG